ncbi:eCIS core domain-containing protein [Palaeococcus ferrophilus]|uniref:eCIS core domain-containing protein n=1 Tax=Palaeococcus ferrophilus TaxID=83868 RepID=UPI00064F0C92|nr:DUF4157 domain-containing protein [Palaeococcus ferrophilus]
MRKRALLALLLVFVLLGGYFSYVNFYASNAPEDVLSSVKAIEKDVEDIRNLTFRQEPRVVVLTKEEALRKWAPSKPSPELMAWEEIYKLTLLVSPDYSLIKGEQRATAGWIAATSGNTLYIIEENFRETGDTAYRVIAHELTHVLQKQYFDPSYGNTLDERLAMQALVEGDADLVADTYCRLHGIKIEKITSFSFRDLPVELHYFPYVFGDRFVEYLYDKGGWELVNSAYSKRPLSTAQVMHPELYLNYTLPVHVELEADGQVIHEDTMGEFYIYLLVSGHLGNETGWRVAEGWRGDKLILFTNGSEVLLWKTVWASEEDAREFYDAMGEISKDSTYARVTLKLDGRTVLYEAVRESQPGKS